MQNENNNYEIEKLKQNHEAEIESLKKQFMNEILELKSQHALEIQEIKRQHQFEIETTKKPLEKPSSDSLERLKITQLDISNPIFFQTKDLLDCILLQKLTTSEGDSIRIDKKVGESASESENDNSNTVLLTSLKSPIVADIRKSINDNNAIAREILEDDDSEEFQPENNLKYAQLFGLKKNNENKPGNIIDYQKSECFVIDDDHDEKNQDIHSDNIPPLQLQSLNEPQFSETELSAALNAVISRKMKPIPEMHQAVVAYTKKLQIDAMVQEDYDKAQELNDALTFLGPNSDNGTIQSQTPVITIDMRIEQTKQNIQDVEEKYKQKLASFEQSKKFKLQEIEATHQNEIKLFEENVSSPEFMHQFDKPSTKLLQTRELQKCRALQKDFAGAKQMKKLGDELEKEETKEAKRRATQKIEILYQQLLQKQKREVECAKQNWRRQKTAMELEHNSELGPLKALLNQLENNGHQSLKYTLKQRSESSSQPSYAPIQCGVTPRTRKKVVEFKSRGQGRLNLTGIDTTQYIKPRPSTSQKRRLPKADY